MGQTASKSVTKTASAAVSKVTANAAPSRAIQPPVKAASEEMPDDLLQFLQDAGPLKSTKRQERSETPWSTPQRQWQVQSMRLAENVPGHDTKRTTSFSYRSDSDDTFRLDVVEFYPLLLQGNSSVKQFYQQHSGTTKTSESDIAKLQDTIRFLQIPCIMKDAQDNSYIGVRSDQVPFGLEETNPEQVKLVIQDLWELEQQTNS